MATFAYEPSKHQKKDGTINVRIRVTHHRQNRYLKTNVYLNEKQLNGKKDDIKDYNVRRKLDKVLDEYRDIVTGIPALDTYTVDDVVRFISKSVNKTSASDIDFFAFIQQRIDELRSKHGKEHKTATGYNTVLNSLKDFFNREVVPITEITSRSLERYIEFLQTERQVIRPDRNGVPKKVKLNPVGNGVNNYMRNIRALFNDAMEKYNDEDLDEQVINHYPFKKLKIPKTKQPARRNVSLDIIKKVRDLQLDEKDELKVLSRDVILLLFYLVGINLKDLYVVPGADKGRLTYHRSKTKGRRSDEALISIKIEPEAMVLVEKYKDPDNKRLFNFYHRYNTINNFTKGVNKGLSQISEQLQIPGKFSSGSARSSWATIARNICKISKDDVDLALNHVDPRHKLADIYIEKDFKMIDESNRKVLDTLRS